MGIFGKDDHQQNLVDIYEDLLEEKQDQLDDLDGVEGAEVESRREKLTQQIANLRVSLEQAREAQSRGAERGEESYRNDEDFFDE